MEIAELIENLNSKAMISLESSSFNDAYKSLKYAEELLIAH
jgi:hypothetical protein